MNKKVCAIFASVGGACLLSGCWYSPWENLAYEAVSAPASHREAQEVLKEWDNRKFDDYRIGGLLFSVMLRGEGSYTQERGPFTLSLSIAKKGRWHSANNACATVQGIAISRLDDVLWTSPGFQVELTNRETVVDGIIAGYKKFLLPDVLNPKDGKSIRVVIVVKDEDGNDKTLTFDFRPKIDRGSIVLFD